MPDGEGEPTGPVPDTTTAPGVMRPTRPISLLHLLWALIPVLSVGVLLPVPFVHAAVRLRQRDLWVIAGAYSAVWLMLVVAATAGEDPSVGGFVAGVIGTVHALRLRHRVFARPFSPPSQR